MVGWHYRLDGHGFEWTPGTGDGQEGLACCSSWGRKELDMTERLNWTELRHQWTRTRWGIFLMIERLWAEALKKERGVCVCVCVCIYMFVSMCKCSSESVHLHVCGVCGDVCVWNSYWSQFIVSSGGTTEKHRMKKHSQLLFTSTNWLIRNPEMHRDLLTPKAWKRRPTLLRRLGNSPPKASSLSCSFLSCEMKS